MPTLKWTPTVRPRYAQDADLPANAWIEAITRAAQWYRQSRLLVGNDWVPWNPDSNPGIEPLPAHWSVGDGSLGIAECYISKRVFQDGGAGAPTCRSRRLHGRVRDGAGVSSSGDQRRFARDDREKLERLPLVSLGHGGGRAAGRPAASVVWNAAHNAASPGNTHFWGDDNARVLLGTIASSSLLQTDRWDEAMCARCWPTSASPDPTGITPAV